MKNYTAFETLTELIDEVRKNGLSSDKKDLMCARKLMSNASAKEINRLHRKYPAKVEYLTYFLNVI